MREAHPKPGGTESMMPALFSGVSGLKNHQFRMNVIGNNLSNVNTIGYKYNRVSFADLVYQTIRDASAPQAVGERTPFSWGWGRSFTALTPLIPKATWSPRDDRRTCRFKGTDFLWCSTETKNKYSRAG
jgi:flagellar hook protein FlgE